VQWFSTGVLKDRLRKILSAGNLQLQPDVLISTCHDWIEALVKHLVSKTFLFAINSFKLIHDMSQNIKLS